MNDIGLGVCVSWVDPSQDTMTTEELSKLLGVPQTALQTLIPCSMELRRELHLRWDIRDSSPIHNKGKVDLQLEGLDGGSWLSALLVPVGLHPADPEKIMELTVSREPFGR